MSAIFRCECLAVREVKGTNKQGKPYELTFVTLLHRSASSGAVTGDVMVNRDMPQMQEGGIYDLEYGLTAWQGKLESRCIGGKLVAAPPSAKVGAPQVPAKV